MTIDVLPRTAEASGKLADVELQFRDEDRPLDGLKLTGSRSGEVRPDAPCSIFPARTYTLAGRQRCFDGTSWLGRRVRPARASGAFERHRDVDVAVVARDP